jgi:hypothetical protein
MDTNEFVKYDISRCCLIYIGVDSNSCFSFLLKNGCYVNFRVYQKKTLKLLGFKVKSRFKQAYGLIEQWLKTFLD